MSLRRRMRNLVGVALALCALFSTTRSRTRPSVVPLPTDKHRASRYLPPHAPRVPPTSRHDPERSAHLPRSQSDLREEAIASLDARLDRAGEGELLGLDCRSEPCIASFILNGYALPDTDVQGVPFEDSPLLADLIADGLHPRVSQLSLADWEELGSLEMPLLVVSTVEPPASPAPDIEERIELLAEEADQDTSWPWVRAIEHAARMGSLDTDSLPRTLTPSGPP